MKNKNLDYYLNLPYTIEIKPYYDGSYFASIAELPGCITEGDTLEDTMIMIQDAKKAWLESALDDKVTIPEPVNQEFSGKFNVRVPKSVHKQLVYRARQEGVSLNTFITSSLGFILQDKPTPLRKE